MERYQVSRFEQYDPAQDRGMCVFFDEAAGNVDPYAWNVSVVGSATYGEIYGVGGWSQVYLPARNDRCTISFAGKYCLTPTDVEFRWLVKTPDGLSSAMKYSMDFGVRNTAEKISFHSQSGSAYHHVTTKNASGTNMIETSSPNNRTAWYLYRAVAVSGRVDFFIDANLVATSTTYLPANLLEPFADITLKAVGAWRWWHDLCVCISSRAA